MSFQIKSFQEYKDNYKKSIENPESFWEEIANNFVWKKNQVEDVQYTEVIS